MVVPDAHYTDPELAALYDAMCRGREDFSFYLPLVGAAESVLDVGCGTGELLRLARAGGHAGRLVGLDPAAGMLGVARVAGPGVEWVEGTLPEAVAAGLLGPGGGFDLVVMTGNAFQVLVEDADLHAFLCAVRVVLGAGGGRFVFETRNRAVRGWEAWDGARSAVASPDGELTEVETRVAGVDGERVAFTQTYARRGWPGPRVSRSVLRFLDPAGLDAFLAAAGLSVAARYGDWRREPFDPGVHREIVTVAVVAPGRTGGC